ncbi:hypothetical protein HanHA89_Chr07g0276741 [Helianthus annuus]|nr:hypothetical protein HanHA89_Chr07g0276741 [Helianthus annuus]
MQVKLVSPSLMPKLGKAGSLQSRHAIVHNLVHTESWAIDLSWVLYSRTSSRSRLEELGSYYGAIPAHDGLWDSAVATSKDLFARLCTHMYLYAYYVCTQMYLNIFVTNTHVY